MDNLYSTLIEQTFNFPQEDFEVKDGTLFFNDIPLMDIIKQFNLVELKTLKNMNDNLFYKDNKNYIFIIQIYLFEIIAL